MTRNPIAKAVTRIRPKVVPDKRRKLIDKAEKPFILPEIRMPTLEERRAASAEWLRPLKPCLYTYWPDHFKHLSFKTWVEELAPQEVTELATAFDNKPVEWSDTLKAKIHRGTKQFDTGCFFKLESRSPKDNYWAESTNFRACSWQDVKRALYSERMLDDISRYLHLHDEPLRLLFREWHPIQKSSEFRCFIRDRKLVGISQYHYAGFDECWHKNRPLAFADIFARVDKIRALITRFIDGEIIPHLHTDNLVVDLWIDHMQKVTLIEINPYRLSDPCLLTYQELADTEECLFKFNARPHENPEETGDQARAP